MAKPKTERKKIGHKDLTFTYAEVLKDYISKPRALTKLEYQLNRYQNTIKIGFVTGFMALIISPFNQYLAILPLIVLLAWLVLQYKANELLKTDYETERAKLKEGLVYE
jgi:hypothetical protein